MFKDIFTHGLILIVLLNNSCTPDGVSLIEVEK